MKNDQVIAKIEEIAELADELPTGVGITIAWREAPADLVLLVGLQEGATLGTEEQDGDRVEHASWVCDSVAVTATGARSPRRGPPHLRLILGGKR